ncbi:MAG: UDP-N-acetylmuramoyl-L-alanyl-D-glutamate--2,6-diaminopimelate ligase [Paludibacteraceae bacterium]|nr:UDP-N-acetylmuramoyl-L-alanyl-D-glutamate--2,6-diaminopimelate ligase [Paludibacteraceae bacterium]MBN2788289.1 UDP-N-acetylmuramoyl-L-alanyl-D-glutamate--2,6-diaminopimelate ligase [Paludibacteraceae bacterium]
MKISKLLQQVAVVKIQGDTDISVSNINFDSRKIESGHLFVAIKGTVSDGHDFIKMAVEKGAVAVLCEQIPQGINTTFIQVKDAAEALAQVAAAWNDFPSSKLTLVGVTGTNGKTTTATLLYELFRALGHKVGLLSTVCNYIDNEAVLATHTTPNPLELNALLAQMVEVGCDYAFMEVSSHSVVQKRIVGLDFDGGIFSNITRDHIDYHETFENYIAAKKSFFDGLSSDAFALTNIDDKNGLVMLQNSKAQKKTYSTRTLADFKGKILEESFEGMLLDINGKELTVNFIGKFNVYNLLAVYGAAVLLGKDELEVLRIMSTLNSVSGRFETLHAPKGYTAIVDYAHTPDALNNVLSTINDIREGKSKLITVVGCGGNRDKGKRPMMAKEATNASDKVIITSDNPRNENPQDIIDDMLRGLDALDMRKVLSIIDRRQAIKTACMLAEPGDVILVAGKGHEDYQIIGDVKHHFDDREELRNIFDNE